MKIKPTTSASILLIVVFSLIAAWQLIPAARDALNGSPYLSVIVIQLLILALPSVFYCTFRGKEFRSGLRIRFFPLSAIILIVSASVLMISGGGRIGAGMSALFPEAFSASSGTAASGASDSFYYVIAFAVVPAITEEVLFRGIVLTEFTSKGVFCAVFVSSLAFAMSHFSFVRFPIYLFSGLVLAAVTFAARSLIAAVIVHLINNVFVVFFEDYVIYLTSEQRTDLIHSRSRVLYRGRGHRVRGFVALQIVREGEQRLVVHPRQKVARFSFESVQRIGFFTRVPDRGRDFRRCVIYSIGRDVDL